MVVWEGMGWDCDIPFDVAFLKVWLFSCLVVEMQGS
jgi:hypothetical protein